MILDKKIIGDRIKKGRIAAGFKTQCDFAERMGYSKESRQTVSNWENGNVQPSLKDILLMCELFSCELEYLLGIYPCKTREATDIQAVTGLSQDAIETLKTYKSWRDEENPLFGNYLGILDRYILQGRFRVILGQIDRYIENVKKIHEYDTSGEQSSDVINITEILGSIEKTLADYEVVKRADEKRVVELWLMQKDFLTIIEKTVEEVVRNGDI